MSISQDHFGQGLPREAELPLAAPPTAAFYSESNFFDCYDPSTGIGIYAPLVSNVHDYGLMEPKLVVCLPDGKFLTCNGAGHPASPGYNQYSGGGLTATCLEPYERWRLEFDGGVMEHTTRQFITGLQLRPIAPLRFRLDFEMATPPFVLGAERLEDKARILATQTSHQHQQARVIGEVTWQGKTIGFDGPGHRNHSRGPREFGPMEGGFYASAKFPTGRAYGALGVPGSKSMQFTTDPAAGEAKTGETFENDEFRLAVLVDFPRLTRLLPKDEEITFSLNTYRGMLTLKGRTLNAFAMTMVPPRATYLGLDRTAQDGNVLWANFMRWELDGEVGYGLLERVRVIKGMLDAGQVD